MRPLVYNAVVESPKGIFSMTTRGDSFLSPPHAHLGGSSRPAQRSAALAASLHSRSLPALVLANSIPRHGRRKRFAYETGFMLVTPQVRGHKQPRQEQPRSPPCPRLADSCHPPHAVIGWRNAINVEILFLNRQMLLPYALKAVLLCCCGRQPSRYAVCERPMQEAYRLVVFALGKASFSPNTINF